MYILMVMDCSKLGIRKVKQDVVSKKFNEPITSLVLNSIPNSSTSTSVSPLMEISWMGPPTTLVHAGYTEADALEYKSTIISCKKSMEKRVGVWKKKLLMPDANVHHQ